MRVLIGLAFILGGFSGEYVLRGTHASWPLVLIGLYLVVTGAVSLYERATGRRVG